MKVVINRRGQTGPERVKFSEFASINNLTLEVNERARRRDYSGYGNGPVGPLRRYWVHFDRVEAIEGCMLAGYSGNGDTIAEAIRDYAGKLAGARIVHKAMGPDRREFDCPNEWAEEDFSEFDQ